MSYDKIFQEEMDRFIRDSGEPMSYEDFVKLMNSDKPNLNEVR